MTYLALHEYLSHPCVVKLLPGRGGHVDDAAIERLRNEARIGFRVNDPNVVRVLDCDVVSGVWYFVMEFVDGVDLAAILAADQRLNWRQGVQIACQAAAGLSAIHRAGLLHRDVKPGNLILGADGRVRVADLGVAGFARQGRDLLGGEAPVVTSQSSIVGTLLYTAPEVFRPQAAVGPQADLYSLGATLYHLLTGMPPCRRGAPTDKDRGPSSSEQGSGNAWPRSSVRDPWSRELPGIFQQLVDAQCRPAVWPQDGPEDVPGWLVNIILRLLAPEPEDRFDSADALVEQLTRQLQPGLPNQPRPFSPTHEDARPRGIGVMPLRNELRTAHDDWIGHAIANSLSRAFAAIPGVYVADQEALASMAEQAGLPRRRLTGEAERLLDIGRLVGAGTVVFGRFRRDGARLAISVEAVRAPPEPEVRADVEGPVAGLADLEQAIFGKLARALGLEARRTAGVLSGPGTVPAARERFVHAKLAFRQGDYESAISLAQEAIALDPSFDEAASFVGVCLARLGRYEEAEVRHREREALARAAGDTRRQVEALANLGAMHYFRGDYEAAESHYRQAVEMAGALELATEHAQICNNLGFVLFRRGRQAEAQQFFRRAIDAHRAYGALASLVGPYNGLGNVLVEERRYDEARTYYQRALAIATEIGDRTSVGTTHMHLGRCAALQGRFADAKHEFTMALSALEETRFWNGLARAYEYVAEMQLGLGNYEEAARCADTRIVLAQQHANVRMEAAAWLQKADSLRRAGRAAEATECEAKARELEARTPVGA